MDLPCIAQGRSAPAPRALAKVLFRTYPTNTVFAQVTHNAQLLLMIAIDTLLPRAFGFFLRLRIVRRYVVVTSRRLRWYCSRLAQANQHCDTWRPSARTSDALRLGGLRWPEPTKATAGRWPRASRPLAASSSGQGCLVISPRNATTLRDG